MKTLEETLLECTLFLKKTELPETDGTPVECPKLLVKLSCGLFGISEDFIEKYQSLDALFIKNRFNTYFFEAEGDSMEPTIFRGQILVVDRSKKIFHNKVCVVGWEEKLVCKRIIQMRDHTILRSDNQKYKDIIVSDSNNLILWGVVIANAGFIE